MVLEGVRQDVLSGDLNAASELLESATDTLVAASDGSESEQLLAAVAHLQAATEKLDDANYAWRLARRHLGGYMAAIGLEGAPEARPVRAVVREREPEVYVAPEPLAGPLTDDQIYGLAQEEVDRQLYRLTHGITLADPTLGMPIVFPASSHPDDHVFTMPPYVAMPNTIEVPTVQDLDRLYVAVAQVAGVENPEPNLAFNVDHEAEHVEVMELMLGQQAVRFIARVRVSGQPQMVDGRRRIPMRFQPTTHVAGATLTKLQHALIKVYPRVPSSGDIRSIHNMGYINVDGIASRVRWHNQQSGAQQWPMPLGVVW